MKILLITLIALIPFMICACYFLRHYLIAIYLRIPWPKHAIQVRKNIKVPMKDGILLATDIYEPTADGLYPVIIARTPYNKSNYRHFYPLLGEIFSKQGYIFIIQDIRGKYQSEGEFIPYLNEASDGHDTIEWAGKLPNSNGKVGMSGISYMGSCAWLAATQNSRYLTAIVPMSTVQDPYHAWFENGIPYLKDMLFWTACHKGRQKHDYTDKQVKAIIKNLPQNMLDKALTGSSIPIFQEYFNQNVYNDFWKARGSKGLVTNENLSILIIGGWYDRVPQQSLEDYLEFSSKKNFSAQLILGPWFHEPLQKKGDLPIHKSAQFSNQFKEILKWFEDTLKKNKRPETRIRYYCTGSNQWKQSFAWPPAEVEKRAFYLSRSKLSVEVPKPDRLEFIYDPLEPVPSIGTHMVYAYEGAGPADQTPLSKRKDVLTFTTEPLESALTIAGAITVELEFETTAIDTDFVAKIADVHPNGKSYYLRSGAVRLRYQESTQPLVIPLHSLAHTFQKGHRVQLLISSSDFPNRSRNLNAKEHPESAQKAVPARQTIFTGKSKLLLPIISPQEASLETGSASSKHIFK